MSWSACLTKLSLCIVFRKEPPGPCDEDKGEWDADGPAEPMDTGEQSESGTDGICDKQGNARAEAGATTGAGGAGGWRSDVVFWFHLSSDFSVSSWRNRSGSVVGSWQTKFSQK